MNVRVGLEVLLNSDGASLRGSKVGLVAAPTSVDSQLVSSAERLQGYAGLKLVALFGPEHGLRGEAQAGQHVTTYTDSLTGLPVYSLYGDTQKPTSDMLKGLDALLFDIQDGGIRFYTYLSTLAYSLQAGAENGVRVVVLDRPVFLNGQKVEGPVLDPAYSSFVGAYPIPIRYGMTAGEIARLFNETFQIHCDLMVLPMEGWKRSWWFDQTGLPFVPPSPNLPTLDSLTAYTGTCLFEGTNLSEGRGTTRPFEYIGAPWIHAEATARELNALNLAGARFRPVYFVPTFSKYAGQSCAGVHLYITDREKFRPVETALHLLAQVKKTYPDQFEWRAPWSDQGGQRPIDLLSGSDRVRRHLDAGLPVSELVEMWQEELSAFMELRANFLLYA